MFKIFSRKKEKTNEGLKKTNEVLSTGISSIFSGKKLDDESLAELEELLITSDMGAELSMRLVDDIRSKKFKENTSIDEVKNFLSEKIAEILAPHARTLDVKLGRKNVFLFIGVNGSGKTTCIGKIASNLKSSGSNISMVACDTFRAAAVEQLKIWAQRAAVDFHSAGEGSDAAALAYDSIEKSNSDVVMIDTAGRLQNKSTLMDELKKITRVIKKLNADFPHEVVLVLDGTTGQNSLNQVEVFAQEIGVTGLIVNKLDGTAKGGFLVNVVDKFKLPVFAIGVGEGIDDLQEFDAQEFAKSLF